MSKIERSVSHGIQPSVSDSDAKTAKDLGTIGHLNGSPAPAGSESAARGFVVDKDLNQPGMARERSLAGDEAGTLKMEADLLRNRLENAISPDLQKQPKKGAKWEGPDLDGSKNE